MENLKSLDSTKTALILVDLQKGIVSLPASPISSDEVINNANKLLDRFHNLGGLVIFIRVAYFHDYKDLLRPEADEPALISQTTFPKEWSEIVPGLKRKDTDLVITKRQWGAFYGTELDLELRRRKIDTIVLGGISTNYGVESTARDGFERGYQLIFASDMMSSRVASDHEFALKRIFPRMGLVRSTGQILEALKR